MLLNRRGWSNFLSCRVLRAGVGVPGLRRDAGAPPRRRARWPATTAATASRCPGPAASCGSVSVARHGAGTEQLERELEALVAPASRCSGSTPTSRGRRRRGAGAAPLRRRRRPACSWAPRWWPRATTSRTSRWAWCWTPTPRCASPTSAPRSARSRWWPSWRAAAAAAPRGGRVMVQALDPDARALRHAAATTPTASWRASSSAARRCGYPPYGHLIRVVCSSPEPGPELAAAEAVRERIDAAGVPVLGPGAAVPPRRGASARSSWSRRASATPAIAAVRAAVEAVAAERAHAARQLRGRRRPAVARSAVTALGGRTQVPHGRPRPSSRERRGRGRRARRPARPRGGGPPRGRDVVHPPLRRPRPQEPRHAGRPLRRRAARPGRADGGPHARRPRRGPGRAAARASRSGCWSTGSAPTLR